MYKVVILGCENSHADGFLNLIKAGKYPEIEVVGIYSDEADACERLHNRFGVPVMEHYADAVGQVDGVIVTARHGDNHYKYAKPYLDDGVPMFIDKPIACSEADAVEFMRVAKEKGIRLCGGSNTVCKTEMQELARIVKEEPYGPCRGGNLVCPTHEQEKYGGFFFYTSHLAELMLLVFGTNVQAVHAQRNGDLAISIVARYPDFDVTATYLEKMNYYQVTVYTPKRPVTDELISNNEGSMKEMDEILALLKGEPMQKSYEEFILPVFLLNAIKRSTESGQWEEIQKIQL